ncbi:MAG TPA: His/Gly/Thr/Pro-type tRNA ligase C-terminal domain-containing protein, partial [Thermoanaerobaculia bacterium]|nr:His/Gly/Thr/Pro-type tRNA ligase C-terminal domain-containing protein [Thermoanaerobaculia bacterium]
LSPLRPGDVPGSLALVAWLRRGGIRTDLDASAKGPGRGIKGALKKGIPVVVLLGEEERRKGTFVVKDLGAGKQEELPRERLVAEIAARIPRAQAT